MVSGQFLHLLKNTKLSSVAKPNKKFLKSAAKTKPTHQIIQTTSASLNRNDYGLKASLPSKIKSRYIVFDKLDTMQHMTSFEAYSGIYWTKKKFQEMGVPVITNSREINGTQNSVSPLFLESEKLYIGSSDKLNQFAKEIDNTLLNGMKVLQGNQSHFMPRLSELFGINSDSTAEQIRSVLRKLKSLRKEFQQYVLEKHPHKMSLQIFNKDSLSLELLSFISKKIENKEIFVKSSSIGSTIIKHNPRDQSKGTAGLSYLQKGRLMNTLNGGYTSNKVVPGRILDIRNAYGAAGFITQLPNSMNIQATAAKSVPGKHFKEIMVPTAVKNAILKPNGSVELQVEGFNKASQSITEDSDIFKQAKLQKSNSPIREPSSNNDINLILNEF